MKSIDIISLVSLPISIILHTCKLTSKLRSQKDFTACSCATPLLLGALPLGVRVQLMRGVGMPARFFSGRVLTTPIWPKSQNHARQRRTRDPLRETFMHGPFYKWWETRLVTIEEGVYGLKSRAHDLAQADAAACAA